MPNLQVLLDILQYITRRLVHHNAELQKLQDFLKKNLAQNLQFIEQHKSENEPAFTTFLQKNVWLKWSICYNCLKYIFNNHCRRKISINEIEVS